MLIKDDDADMLQFIKDPSEHGLVAADRQFQEIALLIPEAEITPHHLLVKADDVSPSILLRLVRHYHAMLSWCGLP